MMTLLASIFGFIAPLFTELLKMWRGRMDQKHEAHLLGMQIERERFVSNSRLEEIEMRHEDREVRVLQAQHAKDKKVEAFSASVRPVLAYGFFVIYVAMKITAWYLLQDNGAVPVFAVYEVLWTEEDSAIFAGIISFYFGSRTLQKGRRS